jgi:hypothetical protein
MDPSDAETVITPHVVGVLGHSDGSWRSLAVAKAVVVATRRSHLQGLKLNSSLRSRTGPNNIFPRTHPQPALLRQSPYVLPDVRNPPDARILIISDLKLFTCH